MYELDASVHVEHAYNEETVAVTTEVATLVVDVIKEGDTIFLV